MMVICYERCSLIFNAIHDALVLNIKPMGLLVAGPQILKNKRSKRNTLQVALNK
jgi:hypothetical protein